MQRHPSVQLVVAGQFLAHSCLNLIISFDRFHHPSSFSQPRFLDIKVGVLSVTSGTIQLANFTMMRLI